MCVGCFKNVYGARKYIERYVRGNIDPDNVVMGKLPLFTQYEEAKIVEHFKTMASFCFGYTVQECVDLASDFATQLGTRSKDKPLLTK